MPDSVQPNRFNWSGRSITASGAAQSLTANNPELDPFRSNDFDFSAEWYFTRGGLLAGTVFYKDIVSLVERQQTQIRTSISCLRRSMVSVC